MIIAPARKWLIYYDENFAGDTTMFLKRPVGSAGLQYRAEAATEELLVVAAEV
jgi:hypothetical protein